jgi:hypothetical protein
MIPKHGMPPIFVATCNMWHAWAYIITNATQVVNMGKTFH